MTQIANAMAKAGIKVKHKTLAEKIWLYLKDKPNMSGAELTKIYGSSVGPTLRLLIRNGLVTSEIGLLNGGAARRNSLSYRVVTTEYEPVSYSKMPKAKAESNSKWVPKSVPTTPMAELKTETPQAKDATVDHIFDALTIRQAKTLQTKLNNLFKGN